MRYLLDTNIVSDLMRDPRGRIYAHITSVGERAVVTSIVVAAELRFGIERKGSPQLTRRLEAILGVLEILPLEAPVDAVYGRLRATLERTGQPIGANDLLIAAQAVSLGLTVVTDNEHEFRRVEGLTVENWLRA